MAEPKPFTARQEKVGDVVIKIGTKLNNLVYKLSGGKIGGKFPGGAPVCLVTTKGRKSGEERTVPLLYLRDGDNVVIVASKGGMSKHPHWFLNLRDDPKCTIQIGRDVRSYVAEIADSEQKSLLWPRLVSMYKSYDDYQSRTDRDIPVLICRPS